MMAVMCQAPVCQEQKRGEGTTRCACGLHVCDFHWATPSKVCAPCIVQEFIDRDIRSFRPKVKPRLTTAAKEKQALRIALARREQQNSMGRQMRSG